MIREKCKSKIQGGVTSHQSEGPSSKSLQTTIAGEGVEKREPSYTVGGAADTRNGSYPEGVLPSRSRRQRVKAYNKQG